MGKFDLGDEAIITAMNNIFPVEHFCACSIHPPPPCWLTYSLTHAHTHQFPVGPSSGLWSPFSFSPDDLHISNDTTVVIENLLNLLLTNHPTFVTFQGVRKEKKASGSPAAGERWEKDICNNVEKNRSMWKDKKERKWAKKWVTLTNGEGRNFFLEEEKKWQF